MLNFLLCFEGALAEIQRVAYLAAEFWGCVKELLFFTSEEVFSICWVLIVSSIFFLPFRPPYLTHSTHRLAILAPVLLQFFLLMMEEASENGIRWQNATGAHRLIHSLGHFKHAVPLACVNDHIEDVCVGQTWVPLLQLADDLQQLIRPEQLLFFILLP